MTPYQEFGKRLKLLISKHPHLIVTTLSNVFTMRLIGNKTHGDLAEIAIAEFINQYMYDYRSVHVGKDLYRAKSKEEDIKVISEVTHDEFPVSLKAYGDGPLQLSTDKEFRLFPLLSQHGDLVEDRNVIASIFENDAFANFRDINVLPLIYDEKKQKCNILVFDFPSAMEQTVKIVKEVGKKGRKHPVYRFYAENDDYLFEVRYGDAAANALQRGLWTHTKNAFRSFDSITGGWIDYSHNKVLVSLFSHALIGTASGHEKALEKVKEDIEEFKYSVGLGAE